MKLSDFNYDLPEELIAQNALEQRSASRLLVVNPDGSVADRHFSDILSLLDPGDLLVFNNTRVIPARLFGHKESGGKVELLVERILDEKRIIAHVRANKAPKPGNHLILEQNLHAHMVKRHDTLFEIAFESDQPVIELLDQFGHIPLPPYIERADTENDRERYQTVYARRPGAVAAPTAGLHFTRDLLGDLQANGVETAEVTLHVGAGTFQPVRVDNLEDHEMHAEWVEVDQSICDAITSCKARGGKVVAVGTTSVRSLEAAAHTSGQIQPFRDDTRLFITPGFRFNVVDAMITNFHLPESTLLMLVSAFSGYDTIMSAYAHAVRERYRFFSYGDAMFLTRKA